MIKEINNLEEFNALINQDKLVVVDFWAEWCAPCRAISPFFDRLAEETAQAEFAKLNADKAPVSPHFFFFFFMRLYVCKCLILSLITRMS
jgi:thiol-disulfide isomerase/thioredoxin